ncbi:MAG: PrsW family glutamic-type intramembrane protease [Vicinamibacterales bacterium]
MTAVAFAFLPVLVFLALLLGMDSFKLVPARAVLLAFAAGAAAALLSVYLQPFAAAAGAGPRAIVRVVAPITEETAKGLLIVGLIALRRVGFPVDAAIQGFAVGAGFALLENVIYLGARPGAPFALWIVRGFGTAILHGSTTAVFAMIAQRISARFGARSMRTYAPGLAVAVAMHAAFNSAVLPPFVEMLVLLATMPLVLLGVFEWSERAMREWIGSGLDLDVALLQLVTSADFHGTHFAAYLQQLRDRFPGPVVADMLCLLRLQLELSAEAKGKLVARAAGLAVAPDDDTRAALEELRALRASIGRTGLLALEPLRVTSDRDHWHGHLVGR